MSTKDTPEGSSAAKAYGRKRINSEAKHAGAFSPLKKRKSSAKDRRLQDRLNKYHQDEKFQVLFQIQRERRQAQALYSKLQNIIHVPLNPENISDVISHDLNKSMDDRNPFQ
eukprot:NODE_588_length_1582_cov_88.425310_g483_i0.p1 GENE.NODE_588_length_1582_cov_88.425310_g483_i0~~NODE_588_length_1582_cov_88.425310_g483_i0.p1  ORF type:complete len:112 (-),score=16.74 NODE_588_length_1582_cov_88.425310_g483_i0:614-949(-)